VLSEQTHDTIDRIHSLTARKSEVLESSGGRPCTESTGGDSILSQKIRSCFEWNSSKRYFIY
jgi:hypothetical protein